MPLYKIIKLKGRVETENFRNSFEEIWAPIGLYHEILLCPVAISHYQDNRAQMDFYTNEHDDALEQKRKGHLFVNILLHICLSSLHLALQPPK